MGTVEDTAAQYKSLLAQIADNLTEAQAASDELVGHLLNGRLDEIDSNAARNAHALLTDSLAIAKSVLGEPQGNPVPDTAPAAPDEAVTAPGDDDGEPDGAKAGAKSRK